MGLFKSIKKLGKKVLKGAKKVFKKAMKFVGKIAGSKWGKALLIAGSVVMGGIAIYGAMQGVAAAGAQASFMTKFAAGAKGMGSALMNPVSTAKGALAGAQGTAGGVGSMFGGAQGAGAIVPGAGSALAPAGAAGIAPGAANIVPAASNVLAGGASTGVGSGGAGFLSRAGTGALNFAKSAGGGQLISGAVQGYAQGKMAEEELERKEAQQKYINDSWKSGPGEPRGGFLSQAQQSGMVARPEVVAGSREDIAGYARAG